MKSKNKRISLMIDGELMEALKAKAKEFNIPYQTLFKIIVRHQLGTINRELAGQLKHKLGPALANRKSGSIL